LSAAPQLGEEAGALAWVGYMRWARSADGVTGARKLFVRARKWPRCPWQARARSCCSLPRIPLTYDARACTAPLGLKRM
jgi:hypothetical protein